MQEDTPIAVTYGELDDLVKRIKKNSVYDFLSKKPSVNSVTLQGDRSLEDLGVETLTNIEIDNIINSIV